MTTTPMKVAMVAGLAMPLSFVTALAGVSGATDPAALDDGECLAVWSEATAGEDRLSYDKAAPYVSDLHAADPDSDGYFDKTEFIAACQKGLVERASKDTAAPKSSHVMLPRGLRE